MKQMLFLSLLLSLSTCSASSTSSLYEACCADDIAQVKTLLESGINVNNNAEMAPLFIAAMRGNIEMIHLLIDAEATIDIQNDEGKTPFQLAITLNRLDVAEILLQHGANVNTQDNDGQTPLHSAIVSNSPELVRFLLDHGADQNLTNKKGFSPKDIATFAYKKARLVSYKDIVKILKSYSK